LEETAFFLNSPVIAQSGSRAVSLTLSKIGGEIAMRCDFKYRYFWNILGGNLFGNSIGKTATIKSFLHNRPKQKIQKGFYEDEFPIIELEHIEQQTGRILDHRTTTDVGSDKLVLAGWDIFTNKLRPYLGKTFLNPKLPQALGSTEWIPLKVNDALIHPKILQMCLLHKAYISTAENLMSGKNHPRISEFDLFQLRIPLFPFDTQDKLVNKIIGIEEEIEQLLETKEDSQEVVNEVFGDFLGIDLVAIHSSFGKGMTAGLQRTEARASTTFEKRQSDISYSLSLRTSSRFHRPQTEELMQLLMKHPVVSLQRLLKTPVRRGVQPKVPKNPVESEIVVIKTAQLKNEYIDISDAERVSTIFFLENRKKAQPLLYDVLLASTGKVSLGKVDLFELDEPALVDGHVSIINLNADSKEERRLKALFLIYYLRSIFGVFQIERDFSGTTNQIEIYPDQISRMKILDLGLTNQEAIVNQVYQRLAKNQEVEHQIKIKRDKISLLIEETVNELE
jgi:type I restriction enzyme, S subunit